MKIIDIRDKKIIYSKNLGDRYYWEYKFIVEIDEDNYCLINYDGSMSGWIHFRMECADEGFISAFMKDPYDDNYINFDKSNKLLGDYISDYNLCDVKDVDVVIIPKEKIQKYLDLFASEVE